MFIVVAYHNRTSYIVQSYDHVPNLFVYATVSMSVSSLVASSFLVSGASVCIEQE